MCRCVTSWSDLDLTFGLDVVTLSSKIMSGLYFRNRKVLEVDSGRDIDWWMYMCNVMV